MSGDMTEELPDPSELFVKNEVLHVTRWTDMLVRLVLAGPVALLSILVDASTPTRVWMAWER